MLAPMAETFDVAVVGLGALGSAAAYHLALRGRSVLGLDRFTPPHAFGSSHGKSRIIREAYFEHPLYVPLVQRAYELWAGLEQASGDDLLCVTGGLMLGPPDGVLVTGALRSAREHRLPHAVLGAADVSIRFPALRPRDDLIGVWEPRAGVLFPEACIAAHLRLAQARGAALNYAEPLLGWHGDGRSVRVLTNRAEYRVRSLLFATGSWIGTLIPELKLPFTVERQVLYWFAPRRAPDAFAPARCPIHLWESAPHVFFYGFPDFGDGVKVARHHGGAVADPDRLPRDVGADEVEAMRAWLDDFVPDAGGDLRSAVVCMYTNTPDEHFWIDSHPDHPNVLIASACSGHGFKFSSVLGEALADLLVRGASRFDLSPFRRR
jgi:sarcosine oxidase